MIPRVASEFVPDGWPRRGLPPEFANAKVNRLRFVRLNALATLITHAHQLIARLGETLVRQTRLCWTRNRFRTARPTATLAPAD